MESDYWKVCIDGKDNHVLIGINELSAALYDIDEEPLHHSPPIIFVLIECHKRSYLQDVLVLHCKTNDDQQQQQQQQ